MRVSRWWLTGAGHVALIGSVLGGPAPALAQRDAEAVMAPVQALFDAMRARDSAAARAVFHPEARLVGTFTREGQPVVQANAIDGFIQAIGRGHEEWNERIWDWEVRVADNLATVWTKYDFLLDGELSHCGVDAVQLVKTGEGWKIIQIADTRQREGCEGPPGG